MFRTVDVVLIAVMVSSAAVTYKIKQQAEDQLAAVRKLQAQIRFEDDSIDLLKADWSLLTQPKRLEKLATAYQGQLNLQLTDGHQFVGFEDLPARPAEPRDPADAIASGKDDPITQFLNGKGKLASGAGKTDKIKTGAVKR